MIPTLLNMVPFADTFVSNCNPATDNGKHAFFGLPHWWDYIHSGQYDAFNKCMPHVEFPAGIWAIGLAALDIMLFVAGIVAFGSIIWAGFEYVITEGNSEKGVSARKRVVNSIVGLVIVMIASVLVQFVGDRLG
jgi:hypothetical protein